MDTRAILGILLCRRSCSGASRAFASRAHMVRSSAAELTSRRCRSPPGNLPASSELALILGRPALGFYSKFDNMGRLNRRRMPWLTTSGSELASTARHPALDAIFLATLTAYDVISLPISCPSYRSSVARRAIKRAVWARISLCHDPVDFPDLRCP